jgi:hypothetical protein
MNDLRQLHDATKCPVVFVGRPPLKLRIQDSVDDPRIGGALVGRICIMQDLHQVVADCRAGKGGLGQRWLFSKDEIRELFARYQVSVDAAGISFLWGLANTSSAGCGFESSALRYAVAVFILACEANPGAALGKGLTLIMLRRANRACRGDICLELEHRVEEFLKTATA